MIVAACCSGVILGYLVLEAPIISFSIADVPLPESILKRIDTYLFDRGAQYLLVASMVFILTIPNILLVAVAVSFAMKYVQRPRTVFYATLIWPVLDYAANCIRITGLKDRLNTDILVLIKAENLHTKAFGMLLAYVLFAVIVFVVFRLLSRTRHNPSFQGTRRDKAASRP